MRAVTAFLVAWPRPFHSDEHAGLGKARWGKFMLQLQSALGVAVLLGFAFAISENHRAVRWKSVAAALLVTFAIAVLLRKVPQIKAAFAAVASAVDAIPAATRAGTSFVFGY